MKEICSDIVNLRCYSSAFETLKQVDQKHAAQLETALLKATEGTHKGIVEAEGNPDRLRYWLYREVVEVRAHSSSYLSYSEMMATREANLTRFAMGVTGRFFDLIFDSLDEYFQGKKSLMIEECQSRSEWYSTISDSSKKLLTPVNIASRLVGAASDRLGLQTGLTGADLVDTKGVVESVLVRYLDPKQVTHDVTAILEHASAIVEETWKKEIKAQAPDLAELKAFSSRSTDSFGPATEFQFGIAEQTFAVGVGAALVGSFGLAAGWHTLTYAMINVFPPVAIFSVLAAVGLAFVTKDRALENRRQQISGAADKYHQQLLLQIDTQKMEELGGRSMRDAMIEKNERIVARTIRQWEESISGNLRAEHYRLLIAATTQHLMLVDIALKKL
jgi:hypothetical protein